MSQILDAEGNPISVPDEPNGEGQPTPPAGLEGVPAETLAALRDRIAALNNRTNAGGLPIEDIQQGSGPVEPATPEQRSITGADVDWSEFELDPSLAHLYPQARLQETPEGPKWVVTLDQHHTAMKNLGSYEDRDKRGEAKNLGEYIDDMVNGAEQWTVAGLVPGGTMGMAGVILRRQRNFVLPEPRKLQTEATVEVEVVPEERQADAATEEWMAEEGLTPAEEPATILSPEEEARKARAQELKRKAIEKEEALLTLNAPSTVPAPTEGVEQPEPINTQYGKRAAGAVDAAQRALDLAVEENFGQ